MPIVRFETMDSSRQATDTTRSPGSESLGGLSRSFVRRGAAERLRALGHPDRLRIVEVLAQRPHHVGELAVRLGASVQMVSRHVRTLHAAGIVESSKHGNRVLYVLADREVARLAAVAYRGAAVHARRLIASAPEASEPTQGELGARDER